MIHLVCGPIGAGKTTYAIELSDKEAAIRFSEDEWLAKLFVPDAPDGLLDQPMQVVGAWATEKYLRCRGQIWLVCQQLLNNNVSIVLDGAAANKEQRVFDRNNSQNQTYSLEVTPAMFEHTESFFSPPVGEELNGAIVVET